MGEIKLQKEIDRLNQVFDQNGHAIGGWAKSPLFTFNDDLFKQKNKINHRQCFYVENKLASLFVLMEKCGGEFIVKVMLRDKEISGTAVDCTIKKCLFSQKDIPDLLDNNIYYEDKKIKIALTSKQNLRHLRCQFNNFAEFGNLYFDLNFVRQKSDSLNLVVPFEELQNKFYYKTFVPNVLVSGNADFEDRHYEFISNNGYCDSSSYVLPYRQIYRYVTASCKINGEDFGLYLGSRLGDDMNGEENCYFSQRNIKKLSKIKFIGTDERIDKIWGFKAGINAVNITFKPEIHREVPVFAKCDKTTIVYGSLFGEFHLIDAEPVILTNVPAQMVFTVI